MDKKKYGILAAVVVLIIASVLLFGNVPPKDASGRLSKIVPKSSSEHTLKTKSKTGAAVEVNKKKKVNNVEVTGVKGYGDDNEIADGVDSGLLAGLRASCEEDKNGDGLSDNEYDLVNGTPVPVAIEDCYDWAMSQIQSSNKTEAERLACRDTCSDAYSGCLDGIQGSETIGIYNTQLSGCQSTRSSCNSACDK